MSGGKEAIWRAEMAASKRAYKQQAAVEERIKRRIVALNIALDKSMRAHQEAKVYISRYGPSEEEKRNNKGKMDPQGATMSLQNRAIREIQKARDS